MRFLVDANLSPQVAALMREHDLDATHVVDVGLMTASDSAIFDQAVEDGYVVITTDSDFPMLLALRRATNPSVIHLRRVGELTPQQHAMLIIANLPAVADDLDAGSVISLSPTRLAVRRLPSR